MAAELATRPESLTGIQKAAVLLVAIGEERAGEIFRLLGESEVEAISLEIAKAPRVPTPVFKDVVNEAVETVLAEDYLSEGGVDYARSLLDAEEQAEVARRVALMAETRPEVVEHVEMVMRQKLSNVLAQDYAAAGGVKSLAEILNNADRTTERNVLDQLAQSHAELAEEVRLLLFTFEDVVKLDDRSIQMILKEVDQKDLAIALRGVSEDVRDRIFSNMSERGAELLREEIEFQPPQRRRVVEEAQSKIVAVVRRLEDAGSIVLSRAGSDEDEVL